MIPIRRPDLRALLPSMLVLLAAVGSAWAHRPASIEVAAISLRIADDPQTPSLYLARAELYRLEQRWDAAEADLDRVASLDPRSPDLALCRAALDLDRERPGAACTLLDAELLNGAGGAWAYELRSRAHEGLGRIHEAIVDLDSAIVTSRRTSPDLYLRRALLHRSLGPPGLEPALAGLERGLAVLGPIPGLLDQAIAIECELRRFDDALTRLEQVPDTHLALEARLMERARILERAGRSLEALAAWTDALAHVESSPPEHRASRGARELAARARAALRVDAESVQAEIAR